MVRKEIMCSWLPRMLLVGLSIGLSACSFSPKYERPALPVPPAWPLPLAQGPQVLQQLEWQQLFPDPRLQVLIQQALAHNRDLRIASARVAEARALYGIQRADRVPTLGLAASQATSRTPADVSATGAALVGRRLDVNVGLLPFELDFWGRVSSLSEAAKASYLATEQAQRAFRLSLVAGVADAYLVLLEADERLVLAHSTLASRAQTRDLVERRRTAGLAGDMDFLQADAALEGVRAEIAALQRQQAAARNFLRALVGTESSDLPAGYSLQAQRMALDLQVALPAELLVRRPDILAAEQRLMAANANIGAARAAFFPRISLTAAAGTASRELTGLFSQGSESWSFVPSLSLPIFDAGRNRAGLVLAEVRKDIAVAEYERSIQQAFREVADLLSAREALQQQLQALSAQERAQQRAADIANLRYQQGVSSFLEVLDAQRQLQTVQQSVLQIRRLMGSTVVQLYKALGGDQR